MIPKARPEKPVPQNLEREHKEVNLRFAGFDMSNFKGAGPGSMNMPRAYYHSSVKPTPASNHLRNAVDGHKFYSHKRTEAYTQTPNDCKIEHEGPTASSCSVETVTSASGRCIRFHTRGRFFRSALSHRLAQPHRPRHLTQWCQTPATS